MLIPERGLRAPGAGGFTATRVVPNQNPGVKQLAEGAEAQQKFGTAIQQIGAEGQARRDSAMVREAQALAEERILEQDRTFTGLLGRDASPDAFDRASDELAKSLKEAGDSLDSNTQRTVYGDVVRRRSIAVRDRWARHVHKQGLAHDVGSGKAVIEAKKMQGLSEGPYATIAGEGSPTVAASLEAEVRAQARRTGLSGPETDLFVTAELTELHGKWVKQLLEQGDTEEAGEHLAEVRGQIHPTSWQQLNTHVKDARRQDRALTITNGILDEIRGVTETTPAEIREEEALDEVESTVANQPQSSFSEVGSILSEGVVDFFRGVHGGVKITTSQGVMPRAEWEALKAAERREAEGEAVEAVVAVRPTIEDEVAVTRGANRKAVIRAPVGHVRGKARLCRYDIGFGSAQPGHSAGARRLRGFHLGFGGHPAV